MVSPVTSAFTLFLITIRAQLSIATNCTQSGWEWSRNSLGQDPCAVVETLEAGCKNLASYTLPPLEVGTNYVAPQEGTATGCSCNTVTYSLYQACSQCQIPESGITWSFYEKFCTDVYVARIPLDVPEDTEVPRWAYLDVTEEDDFNLTSARDLTGYSKVFRLPESLAMSSDPADTARTSGNVTGIIVGAAVGGIVAIVLSIVLFWFIRLRKQPANIVKVLLNRNVPPVEEALLSPGPHSPPTITRDLPKNATYRELSRSGVITGYDSSFYPKNVIAPSQNGYHGFAEV